MFLLHKIKSFGLKNIKSIFEELKKMVFWFIKDQICFVIKKKKKKRFLTAEKSDLFFLYVKKEKKRSFLLRREFHSYYEFMQSWIK